LDVFHLVRRDNSGVTVIVSTLNEEEGIGPNLKVLRDVLGDPYLLVVDGNSVDDTVNIAKELGAEVILQEGRGKGLAVAQALKHMDSDPRYVVFIDADYTYPAGYLPEMIKVLEENPGVGMIIGNRFNSGFDFRRRSMTCSILGTDVLPLLSIS
jgi:dolichol-phosphate mannosyltransferase